MKLSDTRIATVLESLRVGSSRRAAAASAGISDETLRRWAAKLPSLQVEIEKAEAEATMVATQSVRMAAIGGDWRAAAWWLERRRYSEWGRSAGSGEDAPRSLIVTFAGECGNCGRSTRAREVEDTAA
jgi:hypothetical protein